MQDFETSQDETDALADDGKIPLSLRLNVMSKTFLKRFVIFVSFGPGILGFLWLLGRILKR